MAERKAQREACFNPRSREGSDIGRLSSSYVIVMFQSTLPRRERRKVGMSGIRIKCFNPRSREGSDMARGGWATDNVVSIHAPAKGATWAEE